MTKNPAELSRDELLAVVTGVVQILYGNEQEDGSCTYAPDSVWSGADVCESLAALLEQFGLVPGPEDDGTVIGPDGPVDHTEDDAEAPPDIPPPTQRYVLFDFDIDRLVTTDAYTNYDEASAVAAALDNVIIVPLRFMAWEAMEATEADEEEEEEEEEQSH
ncbi:MAG: hypothetical protein GXX96_09150 [Planctomycetaceae bacterium]|nr:hypothetical protein [Planctomycetaceae bacterium]